MALPLVDNQDTDNTRIAIENLGNQIMERASSSISAATKSIIPNVPKMIETLTVDLQKGPINSFNNVIVKLERMVQALGLDLREYSTDLADMLQQREEKAIESDKRVQNLKENNIVARVNKDTKEVEILTRAQIRTEEKLLKKKELSIILLEKEIKLDRKNLQTKDNLSNAEKKATKIRLEENSEKLQNIKGERDQSAEMLQPSGSTVDTGRSQGLPMFLEELKDAFMGPFQAIGESFNMIKDMGKNTGELMKFLGGGFLSTFKSLGKGIKAIGGFFTLARLVLIAKFALIVGALTFVALNIKKIKNFFVKIIDWFRNSKLGKLLGLNKDQTPEEKIERKRKQESFGMDDMMSDFPSVEKYEDAGPQNAPIEKNSKMGTKRIDQLNNNDFKFTDNKAAVTEFDSLQKKANEQLSKNNIIINNNSPTVNSSSSGSVVSGFINNRADDSFINVGNKSWADV